MFEIEPTTYFFEEVGVSVVPVFASSSNSSSYGNEDACSFAFSLISSIYTSDGPHFAFIMYRLACHLPCPSLVQSVISIANECESLFFFPILLVPEVSDFI
jgi:hypothetical protein